jgi:hypothetical protein
MSEVAEMENGEALAKESRIPAGQAANAHPRI